MSSMPDQVALVTDSSRGIGEPQSPNQITNGRLRGRLAGERWFKFRALRQIFGNS
jgi:hypothetical protein